MALVGQPCGSHATLLRNRTLTTRPSFARRTLSLVTVLFLISCFGESTGPELRRARLAILPSFANPEAARVVDFDRVRVTLRRPGQTPPALHFDTVITFPPGADTLRIELTVPITGTVESFSLYLAMYNTVLGDTVFTSGPDPITATTNVLNLETSEPVLDYVGVGANAAGVRYVNPQAAAFFGATVNLTAEAFDSGGATIPGTPIQFRLANPADSLRARVPDPDVGQVIAGQQRGNAGIRAELLTGPFTVHALAVQPVANAIQPQSGNNQTGPTGATLGQAVVARVVAADALGVQGVIVTFAVTLGGGTLSALVDTTDANGDVSTQWTLGGTVGAQTMTATAAGVAGSATFGATGTVTAPVSLAFQVNPSNVQLGAVIAPAVEVRLLTASGGTATTATNLVTIAIGTNPAGGVLGGTLAVNAVAGIATFNDLTIDAIGNGYVLDASATGLAGATSAAFNVTAGPNTVGWINPAGGSWSVGANWSTGSAPAAGDSVLIKMPGTYTVTVDQNVTIAHLVVGGPSGTQSLDVNGFGLAVTSSGTLLPASRLLMSSGSVTGAGLTQSGGQVIWQGGTFTGGGTLRVLAGGTLTMGGTVNRFLTGYNIEVAGTGTYNATAGFLQLNNGAQLRVLSGGTFDVQGDRNVQWGSGAAPLIHVQSGGTFTRSAGAGTFSLNASLQNDGVATFATGTTQYAPSGPATTGAGQFNVPAGAILDFGALTLTLGAGSSISGAGDVQFSGGTVTTTGTYNVTGTTRIQGGTFVYDNAVAGSTGNLVLSAGVRGGTGVLQVTAGMTWTGGALSGTGTTRVPTGVTLAASGAGVHDFNTRHVLEIGGTLNYAATGGFRGGDSAIVRILAGATLDLQAPGTLSWSFGAIPPRVENAGTLRYSGTGGAYVIDGFLDNTGTLQVQTDTVRLVRGSSVGGTINLVGANAKVVFDGLTGTLLNGTALTGAGVPELRSGTLTLFNAAAAVSWARFRQTGGSLNHAGLVTVTGTLDWIAGAMQGTGTTRVPTGATLNATGAAVHDFNTRHVLEIGGTLNYTGAGGFRGGDSAIVRILAGATLDLQAPGLLSWSFGAIPPRIENAGTLRYSGTGGTYVIDGFLDNTGTLQVQTDTVRLVRGSSVGGTINLVGANARVVFDGLTGTLLNGTVLTGAGIPELRSGTLTLFNAAAAVSWARFRQTGGALNHAGLVTVTGTLDWIAGAMQGTGTTRVPTGATLTASGAAVHDFNTRHVLEIGGTLNYTGAGGFRGGDSAIVRILAGATLDIQAPGSLSWSFGAIPPRIENAGTLRYSGTGGTYLIDGFLNNTGTLQVQTDTVRLTRGAALGGTLNLPGTGKLVIDGLTDTLRAGFAMTGAGPGVLEQRSGTLTLDLPTTTVALPRFLLSGGSVQHRGTVNLTGTSIWTGGEFIDSGLTRVPGGATLTASGAAVHDFRLKHTLEIGGTVTYTATGGFRGGDSSIVRVVAGGLLDIQQPGSLSFSFGAQRTRVEIQPTGTLRRSGAAGAFVMDAVLSKQGTIDIPAGTLRPTAGSVTFSGAVTGAGTLDLGGGTFTLLGNSSVAGPLVVSAGQLDIGGQPLILASTFSTTNTGTLRMVGASDSVDVTGLVTFGGGNTTGLLTNGAIVARNSFTQTGVQPAFFAQNAHRVRLVGALGQTVSFASPANNQIRRLLIDKTGGTVQIASDLRASFFRIGTATNVVGVTSERLLTDTIYGQPGSSMNLRAIEVTAVLGDSGAFAPDTAVFTGTNQAINTSVPGFTLWAYTSIRVSQAAGTATLNVASLPGDLIANAGILDLNGAVAVAGNFRTEQTGRLQMTVATDSLGVGGNATFSGGSTTGLLTNGIITVKGNFVQSVTATSFAPSGTHRTRFDAAPPAVQTISFANPTTSFFDSLVIDRGVGARGTVNLLTDIRVTRGMTVRNSSDLTGATARVTIAGGSLQAPISTTSPTLTTLRAIELSLTPAIGGAPVNVSPDTMVYNGAIAALPVGSGIAYKSIRINTSGAVTMPADTISADLDIATGTASFAAGTFQIGGKLRTRGTGALSMTAGAGAPTVVVTDSAVFAGGASTALTAGTLQLLGHFGQGGGNAAAFQASGAHTTLLSYGPGALRRTVSFANPGPGAANSRFGRLQIGRTIGAVSQPVSLELLTSVQAGFAFDTSTGATIDTIFTTAGNAAILTADTIQISNTAFTTTRLIMGSATTGGTFAHQTIGTAFSGMNTAQTFVTIHRSPAAPGMQLASMNFASTPAGAGRYFLANVTAVGGGAAITLQASNVTAAAGCPFVTRTGATLPTFTWIATAC